MSQGPKKEDERTVILDAADAAAATEAAEAEKERTDPGLEAPEDDDPTRPIKPRTIPLAGRTPRGAPPIPAGAPGPIEVAVPQIAQTPQPRPAARMPELGLIDPLMKDPEITEIMVNDLRNVMVEKAGKLTFSGLAFQGLDDLNRLVRTILDVTGRVLTPDLPYVDVMLPDGSRANIIGPPLTVGGPCLTIRKFPAKHLGIEELMAAGMLDRRIAYFLNVCVVGRLNVLVSGGTGSGKTTLLNVLATFIPKNERIVSIEDTPELRILHANSVRLQTKPQSPGSPPILARELVANALRMRPDRIVIGECRRQEAFDMLQAMNTGHAGSMTSVHANSPRDALSRIESLCMTAAVELPLTAIRKQIAEAIDLVVQVRRFRNGTRRVTAITEVTGIENDTPTLQDIFVFEPDTQTPGAPDKGRFKCTGLVPTFVDRLRVQGIDFPTGYFG